jgi:hypothetical protein
MKTHPLTLAIAICGLLLTGQTLSQPSAPQMPGMGPNPSLPKPNPASAVEKYSRVVVERGTHPYGPREV